MAENTEAIASSTEAVVVTSLKEIGSLYQWHRVSIPSLETLSPRVGHSMVPLRNGNILIIGGGNHEGTLEELWEVNLGLESTKVDEDSKPGENEVVKKYLSGEGEGFKGRYEFFCAKDCNAKMDKIWIFGGADSSSSMNDVAFIEDGNYFECVGDSENIPSPRTQGGNSALVEIEGNSYLAVFAGGQKAEKAVADGNLYLCHSGEQKWTIVTIKSDTPPFTQGHTMTAFGSKVFVHGGINEMDLHETLYMIDLKESVGSSSKPVSWVLVETTGEMPAGRAAHGMAKISEAGKQSSMYIFGGLGEHGGLNDLWKFCPESLTWTQLTDPKEGENKCHPCPRFDFAMTALQVEDKELENSDLNSVKYLLVHGGMNTEGKLFSDLWAMKIE